MEVDVRLRTKNATCLIFHPNAKKLTKKRLGKTTTRKENTTRGLGGGEDSGVSRAPSAPGNRGMAVSGASEGDWDTDVAIQQRNEQELPALVAAATVEVSVGAKRQCQPCGDTSWSCDRSLLLLFHSRVGALFRECHAFNRLV